MGTGSFGGGSGAFGGGGSGGGGGGGGSGGGATGGTGGGKPVRKTTDSVYDRIMSLFKLTGVFNANPELARVSAEVFRALQNRTRAEFMRATLADPLVNDAFSGLLALDKSLRDGKTLVDSVGAGVGTLADYAELLRNRAATGATDERVGDIVRRALSDLLLRTVDNQQVFYYDTPIAQLGKNFNPEPLTHTADFFIGTVVREAVRRDLLDLNEAGKAAIAEACRGIAVRWIDIYRNAPAAKKSGKLEDILGEISKNYNKYARIQDANK